MLTLYQKIERHLVDNLPFVVYSKPNSNKITGVFQQDDTLHEIKDFTERGFALVSFDGSKRYYIPETNSDIYIDYVKNNDFYYPDSEIIYSYSNKQAFEKLISKGICAIENNQFEKVVLSRKESVEIKNFDTVRAFKILLSLYPSAFKYCWFHPKVGLWIGATPEQFIKMVDDKLKTVALAGTQLFSENIVWENKEKQEQLYVTNYIKDNLKEFTEDVIVSEPYTFKAGSISHLKTDVDAVLTNKEDLEKIILKLHPTPAVCGVPKAIAKEFIIENEGYDREFYSGFLGELNVDIVTAKRNKSDLFVNLRCMKVEENSVNIYVGCGVTKDSNPEKEFLETVNKSMTMKKVV